MDPFRAVLSAVRTRLPDGVEAAELHAFLAQNGDVLRWQLSEAEAVARASIRVRSSTNETPTKTAKSHAKNLLVIQWQNA